MGTGAGDPDPVGSQLNHGHSGFQSSF